MAINFKIYFDNEGIRKYQMVKQAKKKKKKKIQKSKANYINVIIKLTSISTSSNIYIFVENKKVSDISLSYYDFFSLLFSFL